MRGIKFCGKNREWKRILKRKGSWEEALHLTSLELLIYVKKLATCDVVGCWSSVPSSTSSCRTIRKKRDNVVYHINVMNNKLVIRIINRSGDMVFITVCSRVLKYWLGRTVKFGGSLINYSRKFRKTKLHYPFSISVE